MNPAHRHQFTVQADSQEQRLDVFVTAQLPQAPSRSFIQKMIHAGQVTVNGVMSKPNYKVNAGDLVAVVLDESLLPRVDVLPEKMDLDIFYEDDDIVVIHKPVGLTVHPAAAGKGGTLANALVYHFDALSDANGPDRPGIVHRLDKDTSGLIVIAKNNVAHARLGRQFEKHKVYKKYVARVEGIVEFDQGVIDVPLKRHYKYHDQRQVAKEGEEGKEAVTLYQVIRRFDKSTLVALYPQTGRTHQLRVHMRHLGHPILGDDKYGKAHGFSRLALHAQAVGFTHPSTKQYVEFGTPIPAVFIDPAVSV